ncbi:expressed unknown protein [Seminavis robusta]|uniref:Uncharacterized protein n=1 Tax=Seminavis robusta TaxID=568900 RepID=A0A9N8HF76_9STRA|nr:expressed unknown protein [Seminavis robusta]|eukprot:Sro510_g157340.1 n/a (109) ;mRNA; r:56998-57324
MITFLSPMGGEGPRGLPGGWREKGDRGGLDGTQMRQLHQILQQNQGAVDGAAAEGAGTGGVPLAVDGDGQQESQLSDMTGDAIPSNEATVDGGGGGADPRVTVQAEGK